MGLEAAVEWLTGRIQIRHGILSGFEGDGQPKPLDDDVRVLLLQGVRELLTNVAKHAHTQSAREQYPRLPMILVTGYQEDMAQEIAVALKMGAYACLYKPFQIEELLQLLTRIRRQELRRVLSC